MSPRVAVLGMGRMGSELARAFLRAECSTHVYNRTAARCEPLRADGAVVATSVQEAVEAAQVVVVCVQDYSAANRLLHETSVTDALRGKLLLQLGSGSAREGRETAGWASAHGIHYLDGAIMATPNFIGAEGCTILYAGESALYAEHLSLLRLLGGNPQHVGQDAGLASALDSALLAFMWGELFGILQGIVVCEAEGVALETYTRHLQAIRPVMEDAAEDMVARVQTRRYAADETTLATLEAHYGAFKHLRELCLQHGLHGALTEAWQQLFEEAVTRGHAGDDFTALHPFMRARLTTP